MSDPPKAHGASAGFPSEVDISPPIAVEYLLPHRDHMSFFEELTSYTETEAMTHTVVDDNVFLQADGSLHPVALVEYAAQLCAATAGYRILIDGLPPKFGLLVGVRSFDIFDIVRRGDSLSIHMSRKGEVPPIFHTACTLQVGERKIASGTLKLWEFDPVDLPEADGSRSDDTVSVGREDAPASWSMMAAVRKLIRDVRVEADGSSGEGEIVFDDQFPGFRGHFPDYPVVPGVVLLTAMETVAAECAGRRLRMTRIERAKFGKVMFPREAATIRVQLKHVSDGVHRVAGTVERGGAEVARCRFSVEPAN